MVRSPQIFAISTLAVITCLSLALGMHAADAQISTARTRANAASHEGASSRDNAGNESPERNGSITLTAGLGRVIHMAGSAASVFVADPKVAEVKPASATSLFVFGVAPGRTTIAALDANGAPLSQYDVTVEPSTFAAGQARGVIARTMPGSDIHIDTQANGLTVTGSVASAAAAQQAMDAVRGFLPTGQTAINHLGVAASTQVNLRVRIVEMSRSVAREIGINWSAVQSLGSFAQFGVSTANPVTATTLAANALTGGYNFPGGRNPTNVGGIIDALATDQLVHVLAEPNITAISGEAASFLVGGEFPIPVAQQNNTTTVDFKQYGVSLGFVPTVASDGHINLKVRPEVSALSTQGAVQLSAGNSSFQIPALTVRRAETTVELGSGQSFAIAGLLQDQTTLSTSALPFLGEIPIIGALFRSDSFLRNETELVIIVTPYIVRPVSDPSTLRAPDDDWAPPSDFERILLLRQKALGHPAATNASLRDRRSIAIPGDAGFVVQ